MLTQLRIRGLGVIDESVIELGPGMTAFTGETGAGKTMVVSGLGLLLGARADSSIVRVGASRAVVEGRMTSLERVGDKLDAVGAELDGDLREGELLVSRQVLASGRSRASVGGVQVPVGTLAEISGELAVIHGQSEQLRLGDSARQREVLDRFAGRPLADALASYEDVYRTRSRLVAERSRLAESALERAREIDLLTFGVAEIQAVNPQPGEDVELAAEASRLQAVDDLRMLAAAATVALSGDDDSFPGAVSYVGEARKHVEQVAGLDPGADELAQSLRDASFAIEDAAGRVASYVANLEADPLRLETVTSRRAELAGLTRKYGESVDAVLGWARDAAERLGELDRGDERLAELDGLIADADERLRAAAAVVTGLRVVAADQLAEAVAVELAALAMPHARLFFELRELATPGPHGAEQVIIQFSANPGAHPAPLAKAASGGELSRVRLALEVVLADGDPGMTFVFDEVDAGVGGRTATEVGRRLARLARRAQVIVITHLPQVAAFADHQLVVTKSSDGNVTASDVVEVTGSERAREIARMMGADRGSSVAVTHAVELLAASRHLDE